MLKTNGNENIYNFKLNNFGYLTCEYPQTNLFCLIWLNTVTQRDRCDPMYWVYMVLFKKASSPFFSEKKYSQYNVYHNQDAIYSLYIIHGQ